MFVKPIYQVVSVKILPINSSQCWKKVVYIVGHRSLFWPMVTL